MPEDLLDPEIAAVIQAVPMQTMDDEVVNLVRSIEFPAVAPSEAVERREHQVPGGPPILLRVNRPKGVVPARPCVLSIHGGGYVFGRYDMDDGKLDSWCQKFSIVTVSVEYRLAPDTPYPGPLEDCYRALAWCFAHAQELGIDTRCVGVAGVSAGGGLAAALALLARDRGGPPIAFQLLDSPMLDDRQVTHSSQLEGLPIWSRESSIYGWRSYLGALHGSSKVPYTAAPARADDLSGLPPAFVSVGSVDGFLDEGVDYALRMNHAGVAAELHVYPGACHGYHLAADSQIVQQSKRDQEQWIDRQLHPDRTRRHAGDGGEHSTGRGTR
jgi:acetyl esterase/lipase